MMENEDFLEGNIRAAEQMCQDPLNLTFLIGLMVEHSKKENFFSVSRPNTERWNGSAFFYCYYCCKQVQTKLPTGRCWMCHCVSCQLSFSPSLVHIEDLASIFKNRSYILLGEWIA